jgi:hypothetical protein
MALSKFGFGIEIEAVVKPLNQQSTGAVSPQEYYERLSSELRRNGLPSVAVRTSFLQCFTKPRTYGLR